MVSLPLVGVQAEAAKFTLALSSRVMYKQTLLRRNMNLAATLCASSSGRLISSGRLVACFDSVMVA